MICGCSYKGKLKAHLKVCFSTPWKEKECLYCLKRFNNQQGLSNHIKFCNTKSLVYDEVSFRSEGDLVGDCNLSVENEFLVPRAHSCCLKMTRYCHLFKLAKISIPCWAYLPWWRKFRSSLQGGVPRTYDFRCPWLLCWQFPFSDPLKYFISVSITVFVSEIRWNHTIFPISAMKIARFPTSAK